MFVLHLAFQTSDLQPRNKQSPSLAIAAANPKEYLLPRNQTLSLTPMTPNERHPLFSGLVLSRERTWTTMQQP